ncbi:ATP-dependent zinc metalloprotease FtsH [Candidatus Gracilibacteria bacterium]|nr:ATP-dependent zinc metalloprotease FtsH [Candidatus Gracilibacteria bacterium]
MKKQGPKNLPNKRNPFSFLLIIALLGAGLALFFQPEGSIFKKEDVENIPISQLLQKYRANELEKIVIDDQTITAKTIDGENVVSIRELSSNIKDLGLNDPEIETIVEIKDTASSKFWVNLLIGAAPFLLLIMFLVFLSKRAGNMGGESGPFSFGKSRAKTYDKTKHKTSFEDIAGAEEAKEEVFEIVDFLKHPKKYHKSGAKIPKGILLVGPPGTGKTLIARAIAGEASVPFFSVSGSEFVEMFVGVGASRVRDLFKTAKKNAPAIIFIDEIDAIGKQRGSGSGGGHDEREQTLNQILTEMDGFEPDASVIVLAATNRPDVLDKALLRPGRFDRRVHIDLPDMNAREKILAVHSKNKHLEKNVDLKKISSKTVGFSGADLENVMNEAAISSVKQRKKDIAQDDIDNAVEKVSLGPARKSRRINKKERNIIAHHEVGHAISGHFTKNCEPVHKISIISRGGALGVTWFLPTEDTYLNSEQKMKDEMVSLHGGRVAERLIFGQTTTGASNDLERITNIARSMIMTYGMGDEKQLGPVVFHKKSRGFSGIEIESEKEFSENTARLIDKNVQILVQEAEDTSTKILKTNLQLLKTISKDLLEKENISQKEFLAYFEKKS